MLKTVHIKALLVSLVFVLVQSGAAYAQAVPATADSSRVQQRLKKDELPKLSAERIIKVPKAIIASAPKGAENAKFILKNVQIDGMTVYPEALIADMYQEKLGKTVSLADVFGLAERLTVKYRNDGYILSQVIIPPQEISKGEIRLQVVEGFIDKFTIEGTDNEHILKSLDGMLKRLTAKTPLNAKYLERYLLLMNDMPGLIVKSVLSPSTTKTGAADITVIVEQDIFSFVTNLDNRGSRFLGPLQASAGARINSVFGRADSFDVQIVTAPDGMPSRELDYIALDYTRRITSEGTTANIGFNYTETEPGYTLSAFDVQGKSQNFHASVMHPFIRSRAKNFFVTAEIDITDIERTDNVTIGRIHDKITALRLGGAYQFTDRYVGINTIDATLSQGLDLFGATKRGSTNLTRARGAYDFVKLEAEVSRLQRITNKISLLASVKGQKSNHILLSSEEFGVGGSDYGRAYDGSEIVGEEGIAGKLELRMDDFITLPKIQGNQIYTYYDIGKVWDRDNTVVKDKIRSIASFGTGVRLDITDNISASAELAIPLTRQVEVFDDTSPRGFFSLNSNF